MCDKQKNYLVNPVNPVKKNRVLLWLLKNNDQLFQVLVQREAYFFKLGGLPAVFLGGSGKRIRFPGLAQKAFVQLVGVVYIVVYQDGIICRLHLVQDPQGSIGFHGQHIGPDHLSLVQKKPFIVQGHSHLPPGGFDSLDDHLEIVKAGLFFGVTG